jgi:ribosomal protein S18 acetylase RimI-like enzyme
MNAEYLAEREEDLKQVITLFENELIRIPYYNQLAKDHEKEHYSLVNLTTKIRHDPKSIIVAKDQGNIVGICFNRFDDFTIWLEWIITDNRNKRTGVGKKLLEKLFESALERDCHKVWCDCRTDNVISKSFLIKNGFTELCEIKKHWYQQDFILLERFVK